MENQNVIYIKLSHSVICFSSGTHPLTILNKKPTSVVYLGTIYLSLPVMSVAQV